MVIRLIIIAILFTWQQSMAQVRPSELDSLNSLMQKNKAIDLIKYGKARIELKERTTFLNCFIVQISSNNIVYKKGGALHDQEIDKIKVIKFEEYPLILEFDELNHGMLMIKIE